MRLLELFSLIDEIKYFLTHVLAVYLLLINFAILNYPRIFQTIYIQLYNLKLLNLVTNAIYLIYANILFDFKFFNINKIQFDFQVIQSICFPL